MNLREPAATTRAKTRNPATTALDVWRRRRQPGQYDAISSAAAWQSAALEALAQGRLERARRCLERADEIVNGDPIAEVEVAVSAHLEALPTGATDAARIAVGATPLRTRVGSRSQPRAPLIPRWHR